MTTHPNDWQNATMTTQQQALAGWYLDPEHAGLMRWWDGQQWGPTTPPTHVGGFAIAALVLGLVATLFSWLPVAGFAIGLPAVAFGIVAVQRGQNRTMAIFGLTTGAFGVAANIVLFTIALMF